MLKQIEKSVAANIRPILAQHNGDIQVISYENGIVRVRLFGKCSGCPAAMITTEEIIKKKLMDCFPEIKDVLVVQETSPELIEFAKKLMKH